MRGALLNGAELQGASVRAARLDAASLQAFLQGADFTDSSMERTDFDFANVWRARNAKCERAYVDHIGETAPSETISKFIVDTTADIPDGPNKERAIDRMRANLSVKENENDADATMASWRKCEQISNQVSQADFEQGIATVLTSLVCDTYDSPEAIAKGIFEYLNMSRFSTGSLTILARKMLNGDGSCVVAKGFDEAMKQRLHALAEPRP
jgi:hypothetical protein